MQSLSEELLKPMDWLTNLALALVPRIEGVLDDGDGESRAETERTDTAGQNHKLMEAAVS